MAAEFVLLGGKNVVVRRQIREASAVWGCWSAAEPLCMHDTQRDGSHCQAKFFGNVKLCNRWRLRVLVEKMELDG